MNYSMTFRPIITALLVATGCVALGADAAPHDFAKWEKDMVAFEQADRASPPPAGALLFTGASTITRWKSLKADFPALPVLNRGFGGSETIDVTHFADRYIVPVAPRAIYFRSGGNDLFRGKSVEQVFSDFKDLVAAIHTKLPATDFVVISLSPSIARWTQSPKEKALNDLEAAYLKGRPHCAFIDVWDIVLGPDGQPRPELFVADKLHFNEAGYELLAARVRAHLPK
jgi:lysophospholipase L1-like esterase